MIDYRFPKAYPHGELEEVFDNIFFVTGTVKMKPKMAFSRNMVVVRDGESLTIVHTVRLDEDGLKKLDALGRVEHVVRICGFHGMDDPFYKKRYDARVWAIDGMLYALGFGNTKAEPKIYFEADEYVTADSELPLANSRLHLFASSKIPEGLVLLERDGGILITGDSLQNWVKPYPYFNLTAKMAMKAMGFLKPYNVGPGWLKEAKPSGGDLTAVLDLPFEHVLPVHGAPVIGGAKDKFRPSLDKAAERLSSKS